MTSKAPFALCDQCPLVPAPMVQSKWPSQGPIRLAVIGEAPGATEVELNEPFVGPSGKVLQHALVKAGTNPLQVMKTNAVLCRPPNNREPSAVELRCCAPRLEHELSSLPPNTRIVPLGTTARAQLGISEEKISKVRGHWFSWRGHQVMPSWHPAYVLRSPGALNALISDLRKAVRGPNNEALVPPKVFIADSVPRLKELLLQLIDAAKSDWCAFDLETDQLCYYDKPTEPKDSILLLALCVDPSWGVVIGDELLYDSGDEPLHMLQGFFDRMRLIGHNAKFDALHLRTLGLRVTPAFDTMLAHYTLDENSKHGLKELALDYLGVPDYEQDLVQAYLKSRNDRYSKVPFPQLSQYAVWDVSTTLRLKDIFERQLIANNQYEWPFMNIIMPMSWTATEMEWRGIQIDTPYLEGAGVQLQEIMDDALDEMKTVSRRDDLNPNSPKALSAIMYGPDLGMVKPHGKGISDSATSKGAIEQLPKNLFTTALRTYRSAAKMKSSYVDNLLENADVSGRAHCTILIHGTEIGRLSMRGPALMTIPREKGNPYGSMIRGAFIARPGYKLVIGDYSQAELRVLAALSGEDFLIDVYAHDRDLHTEVAIAMFGVSYTKEQRVQCKMFNFAYAYGGTEYSFAQDTGLPLDIARDFVRRYDMNMPKAKAWKQSQVALIRKQGFVVTRFGRRRRFPLVVKENEEDARKSAVHMPVASTAADLTLLSCIAMENWGLCPVLTVHDSILLEVPEDQADSAAELLERTMRQTGEKWLPEVKWKADVEIVDRWAKPLPLKAAAGGELAIA